jgi:Flp pilus assembly protein TadD
MDMVNGMAIPCPCCKASNDAGPNCRRCKADLSLLLAVESERENVLAAARESVRQSRFAEAVASLDRAEQLRRGDDATQLRAVVFLLRREFREALAAYHGSNRTAT